MVEHFYKRESDYEKWCKDHENGLVFNHAGGKTGNVLHFVGCRHLTTPSRIGTYTTRYPKYCTDDITEISVAADQLSGSYGWRKCQACFGIGMDRPR